MENLSRAEIASYAACALVVAVIAWSALRPGDAPSPSPDRAPAISVRTTTAGPSGGSRLSVHVAGAVRRPGLYRLQAGSRIDDAVTQAGGPTRRADLDRVNLAQKVADGQQILVPGSGTAATAAATAVSGTPDAAAGSAIVDLNNATAEQLETLDGVGPATAAKILEYRASHGPFKSVGDLSAVSGIGPKKLAAIRPRVRV